MTMFIPGSEIFSSRPIDPEELRRSLPTRLETHTVRPEKVDELDPLTYEVVRHRLWSVTDEMGETLKRMSAEEGRDFSALTISYKAPLYTAIPDRDGTRRSFSGNAEDIAGDIRSFAAIGVHELILDFRGESIAESIARLQRFAAEVIPLVGA